MATECDHGSLARSCEVCELRADLAESRLALFMPISELCSKHGLQRCSFCERLDCGDNTSAAKGEIEKLRAALAAERERAEELAVMRGLLGGSVTIEQVLDDKCTLPLPPLVLALRASIARLRVRDEGGQRDLTALLKSIVAQVGDENDRADANANATDPAFLKQLAWLCLRRAVAELTRLRREVERLRAEAGETRATALESARDHLAEVAVFWRKPDQGTRAMPKEAEMIDYCAELISALARKARAALHPAPSPEPALTPRERQIASLAYGNLKLTNHSTTREAVERAVVAMRTGAEPASGTGRTCVTCADASRDCCPADPQRNGCDEWKPAAPAPKEEP